MIKGKFIVIEGTDGSGKATQLGLLKARLEKEGCKVETADFPQYYDTFFGKLVGRYLKGDFGGLDQVDPHLASLTYAGDRWQAKEKINRWLEQGFTVLANRYTGANMGFQTGKLPEEQWDEFLAWLDELEYQTYGIPWEDVVVFLHVPVEIGQQLVDKKGHRDYVGGSRRDIHEKDLSYQKKVEKVYLYLVKKYPHWLYIECCDKQGNLMSPETIHELIYDSLRKRGII
jgi:dTMP kinase